MLRKPLPSPPGTTSHVLLHGAGRHPCFFSEDDYYFFLESLADAAKQCRIRCHAYVLTADRAHFLVTRKAEASIDDALRLLQRRYHQYVQRRYNLLGSLWSRSFRVSHIVDPDYLLPCFRYVETVPVRTGIAQHPADYEWSSYRAHAYGHPDRVLSGHSQLQSLHQDPEERRFRYRSMFESDMRASQLRTIERAVSLSRPLGSDRELPSGMSALTEARSGILEVA